MNKLKYPNRPRPSFTRLQLVWLALQLDAEDIGERSQADFRGLSRIVAAHDRNGNATFAIFQDRGGKIYYAKGNLYNLPC